MRSTPHVLAIPWPAQGHVIPLLELSQCLVMHGFRVTFVNSDYNHERVVKALEDKNCIGDQIRLVSIPDGLEPWEDRNDFLSKLIPAFLQVMPGKLEELIKEINKVEAEKITCIIADTNLGSAIEMAKKMNIKSASFWPASTTCLATTYYIPKLLDDGIIESDGTLTSKQMIQLDANMPAIFSGNLFWNCCNDLNSKKIAFEISAKYQKTIRLADYLICNSAYDLEPAAFTSIPEALPIGPLLASIRRGHSAGYFWPEDLSCLKWLDQQPPHSVIYVAFGSLAILDKIQFHELALGLELSNRSFLWVVRPDITDDANNAYPEGFEEGVANRGCLAGWVPQQKVLSHPSIACFFSHCGWNSTVEGISNGLPFLCWPHFADQFLNQSYICDIWKVGLGFDRNESGIITREEIKNKMDQVLGDESFKVRALKLKEIVLSSAREGGHSNSTLRNFIECIKA